MRKMIAAALLVCLLCSGCNGDSQGKPTATAEGMQPGTTQATAGPAITEDTSEGTPLPSVTAQDGEESELTVLFINVGYGDAALIQMGGQNYLVDTGSKAAYISLCRALAIRGVTHLDGVFLTHTHADHIGGTEALSKRCGIDMLYSAEISKDKDSGGNAIEELVQKLSLDHMKLNAGDIIEAEEDAYFEMLGPLEYNDEDDNDNSLVMKLHAGGVTVLLTGDMQFDEEQTLLDSGVDVSADVLKVGNHGNPDATSDAFAQTVGARVAVISTSTVQDEDTPNERVLALLADAQAAVTQDYGCGVLLAVNRGEIGIADPQVPGAAADIAIRGINKDTQTVTLVNNGGDADLSGYFIVSEKGSEVFVFPQGASIGAGESLTVACKGGTGDYIWDEKKVWKKKGGEAGVLYDCYGNELSRFQ